MTEENNVDNATNEEAAPNLTVQDLAAFKTIIDLASQRGAFKPNEMVAIGTVYMRLDKFLEHAQKAQEPAKEDSNA